MDWASTLYHAIAIANGGAHLLAIEREKASLAAIQRKQAIDEESDRLKALEQERLKKEEEERALASAQETVELARKEETTTHEPVEVVDDGAVVEQQVNVGKESAGTGSAEGDAHVPPEEVVKDEPVDGPVAEKQTVCDVDVPLPTPPAADFDPPPAPPQSELTKDM
eukprot:gene25727-33084_t